MSPLRIQRFREKLAHVRHLVASSHDRRFSGAVRTGFARDAEQHCSELLDELYAEQIAAFGEVK